MERRPFLAAAAAALPTVTGCIGPTRVPDTPADRPTGTPTRTAVPGGVSYPDRPEELTPRRARRFVERYEEAYVREDLLAAGSAGSPVVQLSVEDAEAVVAYGTGDADDGYVLVSACGGEARFQEDPDGSGGGYGVNNYGVTHYLGPDEHVRVVYNGFACENNRREPYRSTSPARNRDPSSTAAPAELQLYDFGDDPARVRLGVTDAAGGGLVLRDAYPFYKPEPDHRFRLLVQPRVTVAAGRYRLHVDVEAGGSTTAEWVLPDRDGPAWWGTCVAVLPDGEPVVYTVAADGRLSFDGRTCERLREPTDDG